MKTMPGVSLSALVLLSIFCRSTAAGPVTYNIDPSHTYPSFEGDHMAGLSVWRGKFNESSGTIVLDREAKTGTVEVTINTASVDFGHERMNAMARDQATLFDVKSFPTATYRGTLSKFVGDAPTEVVGDLTLHGVTKPVTLKINQFLCKPVRDVEVCGADASTTFNRFDYGITFDGNLGFKPEVNLHIQVEARRATDSNRQ